MSFEQKRNQERNDLGVSLLHKLLHRNASVTGGQLTVLLLEAQFDLV